MRLLLIAAAGTALTAGVPDLGPAGSPQRREALARALPVWMAAHHVPGVAFSFVAKGELAWARGFGCETEGGAPIGPETPFQVASLGKPLFAHVFLAEAAAKGWDPEAPMRALGGSGPFEALTPAALLSHRAGLVFDPKADRLRVEPALQGRWRYSGAGYQILQRAMERWSGVSLEALAQARIFGPWGLWHTSYLSSSATALPHDRIGRPLPLEPWAEANAASSLTSTAADLGRYLARLMASSEGTRLRMGWPQVDVDPALGLSWGLGWALEAPADGGGWFHWGSNPGFKSFMLMDPARGVGFVILTNGDQGLELIEKAVGLLDPQPHHLFRFYMLHPDD